jgi:hypothetical protein
MNREAKALHIPGRPLCVPEMALRLYVSSL